MLERGAGGFQGRQAALRVWTAWYGLAAQNTAVADSILAVCTDLVGSEPAIWRQLEIRGSPAPNQVRQVLQATFDCGGELHTSTPDDPFPPLLPVDGEIPEALQWLPGQKCEEPGDRPEEDCSLAQLLAMGSGTVFLRIRLWRQLAHRLELVSRLPADEDTPPVRLVDGARRGIRWKTPANFPATTRS